MFPENVRDEGFGNDDEEYIPDYEVDDNEDVTSLKVPITKSTLKGPSSKRRCMSDFLPKQQAEQQKQQQKVDQQHQSLPYHKVQVPMMANNGVELDTQIQLYDEAAAKSDQLKKQKVQQNHVQQQQQKKMLTKYCAPGSMSSYRALRLRQMQRMSLQNESENQSIIHAVNEHEENTAVCFSNDLQQPPDEPNEVQSQRTTTNPQSSAPKKKGRGPTKLPHVHARKIDERPLLILNSYGQPIGPTKQLLSEYSLFLGTLARNPEFLPLNYCDWPSIPDHDKDKVWEYVQTYEERLKKRPLTIPENQFKELLHYWDDEETKEESRKNRANRQLADDMHTMGPTSYAFMREKLKQEDPNKEEPSKAKVYGASRKRKPGKTPPKHLISPLQTPPDLIPKTDQPRQSRIRSFEEQEEAAMFRVRRELMRNLPYLVIIDGPRSLATRMVQASGWFAPAPVPISLLAAAAHKIPEKYKIPNPIE
ncbi:Transcription initiation factor IIB [Bienertia sinuspersici]